MAGCYWREASTLMLVGRTAQKYDFGLLDRKYKNFPVKWTPPDYNILFLKRSSKSSFMPESYVFPGGALDKADLDRKWLSIFKMHGHSEGDLMKHFRLPGNQPELYTNKTPKDLFPELAFRICSIRETFEETGLLLASPSEHPGNSFTSLFTLKSEELREWRQRVHNDASQFINLMQHIDALPAVFSLYEWISWLTPTTFKSINKRFDTAFYIAFVDSEIPLYTHDKHEADELKVEGPFQLLESYYDERISIAPPQIYELSRLLNCSTLEALKQFSVTRSTKGMARWFPVVVQANDGIIFIYPGDSLYPSNPDFFGLEEMKYIGLSVNKARETSRQLNRLEKIADVNVYGGNMVVKNVTQPCGHLTPLCPDIIES